MTSTGHEKIFANYIFVLESIIRTYKELLQLNNNKTNTSFERDSKQQGVDRATNGCTTSLIMGMQTENIPRGSECSSAKALIYNEYHFSPSRVVPTSVTRVDTL